MLIVHQANEFYDWKWFPTKKRPQVDIRLLQFNIQIGMINAH